MPDFVFVRDNQTHYIEVKYRTSGEFDFKEYYDSRGGYPYPEAYVVLVTPKHIKTQKAEKLQKGTNFVGFSQIKDFETDKETIIQYTNSVRNSLRTVEPQKKWCVRRDLNPGFYSKIEIRV